MHSGSAATRLTWRNGSPWWAPKSPVARCRSVTRTRRSRRLTTPQDREPGTAGGGAASCPGSRYPEALTTSFTDIAADLDAAGMDGSPGKSVVGDTVVEFQRLRREPAAAKSVMALRPRHGTVPGRWRRAATGPSSHWFHTSGRRGRQCTQPQRRASSGVDIQSVKTSSDATAAGRDTDSCEISTRLLTRNWMLSPTYRCSSAVNTGGSGLARLRRPFLLRPARTCRRKNQGTDKGKQGGRKLSLPWVTSVVQDFRRGQPPCRGERSPSFPRWRRSRARPPAGVHD